MSEAHKISLKSLGASKIKGGKWDWGAVVSTTHRSIRSPFERIMDTYSLQSTEAFSEHPLNSWPPSWIGKLRKPTIERPRTWDWGELGKGGRGPGEDSSQFPQFARTKMAAETTVRMNLSGTHQKRLFCRLMGAALFWVAHSFYGRRVRAVERSLPPNSKVSGSILGLACVAGGLSQCGEPWDWRHFVQVADGDWGLVTKLRGAPPPHRNFVTSPQSSICHQYKMAPVNAVYRIYWDRQLRRLSSASGRGLDQFSVNVFHSAFHPFVVGKMSRLSPVWPCYKCACEYIHTEKAQNKYTLSQLLSSKSTFSQPSKEKMHK